MSVHIFQDWGRGKGNPKSRLVCVLFRLAHEGARWRNRNRLIWILCIPYLIFYRLFVEWTLGIEIPQNTIIGPGLRIEHGFGLVVNDRSVLGSNVTLRHGTTVGNKGGGDKACPVIGDNVSIGCGAIIIGGIHVGNGALVGAGSVVIKDVASEAVVVGNPAVVLQDKAR